MTPQIRLANAADSASVAALIVAMAAHYGGPGASVQVNAAADMVRATLENREGTQILLAFDESEPAAPVAIGVAFFVVIRPGSNLKGLIYLKDLFVPEPHRGRGTGRHMMAALADYAITRGIGRIDLRTDATNLAAQRLYERLGGVKLPKVAYTFDPACLRSS